MTIANIALPSIQRELDVSSATLPWIINAYDQQGLMNPGKIV